MARYEIDGSKYPNVIMDGTQFIARVPAVELSDAPIGALVGPVHDEGVSWIGQSAIDAAKGILLEKHDDGTVTILLRGLYRGRVYYKDTTASAYYDIANAEYGYPFVANGIIAFGERE